MEIMEWKWKIEWMKEMESFTTDNPALKICLMMRAFSVDHQHLLPILLIGFIPMMRLRSRWRRGPGGIFNIENPASHPV